VYSVATAAGPSILPREPTWLPPLREAQRESDHKTGKPVSATITVQPFGTSLAISPTAATIRHRREHDIRAHRGDTSYTIHDADIGLGFTAVNPAPGYYVAGSHPGTTPMWCLDDAASATGHGNRDGDRADERRLHDPRDELPVGGTVATAIPGGHTFTLKNNGTSAGTQPVDWKVYLSTNMVLDGGDTVVASGVQAALAAGASTPVTIAGNIPGQCPRARTT